MYNGNPICPTCVVMLDDAFVKVRSYIYDHPAHSLMEVCEETGVEEGIVLHLLREGRLSTHPDQPGLIVCEMCGTSIPSGMYCDECKVSMGKGLRSALPQEVSVDVQTQQTKIRVKKTY